MYLLGLDIGSSSVKAAIVDAHGNTAVGIANHGAMEMSISCAQKGYAEQDPRDWWSAVVSATRNAVALAGIDARDIGAVGIAYQMHGLVVVDRRQHVLRPAIIWCDNRAVDIGERAFRRLGVDECLHSLLNSPANFTAAKLRWVRENEPDLYRRIGKFMLPGDYIAMCLTGEVTTTVPGLSEAVLWDFESRTPSDRLLRYFDIDRSLLPAVRHTFSEQGWVTGPAATELGLRPGTPVAYRAGDQPNNAFCLGALRPGQVAGTAGTSGVVYAVSDTPVGDSRQRVNSFAHVNYEPDSPVVGVLLCINGCGSQYRWIREQVAGSATAYEDMATAVGSIPVGSDGLRILPFGNGAERMLGNRDPGARVIGLNFNRHRREHLYRAALEGIAFSFVYGMEVMKSMGLALTGMRVGNDNLFRNPDFAATVAILSGCGIQVVETTGAVGAARGAGYGIGHFSSLEEAVGTEPAVAAYDPNGDSGPYEDAYDKWRADVNSLTGTVETSR